tara:strand:- start:8869 stop:10347 length:1479 start_codon:yes stop_codon:yes gene_type:complete
MFIRSVLHSGIYLSLLWSAVSFAQETSPLPNSDSESNPVLNSIVNSELNSEITIPDAVILLEAQINEVELSGDGFDPKIGELSFDLGTQLAELGLHEDALVAFQRSDQYMKIQEGLYSQNREVSIRKIQEQYIAMKDWESAEAALNEVAWLNARNYDTQSLEYLEILQEMVSWYLAIDYYLSTFNETTQLISAHNNLQEIYEIYELNSLPIDARTAGLAISLNHRMALRDELTATIGLLDSEVEAYRQITVLKRSCQRQYSMEPDLVTDCSRAGEREIRSKTRELNYGVSENQSLTNTAQPPLKAFREAKQLAVVPIIDNSIEYDFDPVQTFFARSYWRVRAILVDQLEEWQATRDSENTLQAHLNLADWYLLFGFQQNAEETYAGARIYADSEGLSDRMHMLEPEPISIEGLISEFPEFGAGRTAGSADFALTINAFGKVERIELLQSDIESIEVLAKLTAELSMARYRPILREGVPIAAVEYSVSRQVLY